METAEKEFFRTKFKKQNAELVISTEGFIPNNMEEQYKKEMIEWLKKLKNFRTDEELVSILTESDRRYTWKHIDDFDEELNRNLKNLPEIQLFKITFIIQIVLKDVRLSCHSRISLICKPLAILKCVTYFNSVK